MRRRSGSDFWASRHECGSGLGSWSSFVWEDVVDGSEGDHDQGESGAGAVEAVGPVDDQAYAPVESFVPGVVDAQPDRGQDPGLSFADGGGEGDERLGRFVVLWSRTGP